MQKEIILMHGFQTYPTPHEDSNLNKINFFKEILEIMLVMVIWITLMQIWNYLLGYHFPLIFSGIDYIEKHITHDRSKKGTDYFFLHLSLMSFLNLYLLSNK